MTISVALFQIIGKKVVFQQRMAMQEVFSHTPREDIFSLLRSVLIFTFSIETAGAVVLFLHWHGTFPFTQAMATAVFHSVSAFCNAGFSLFSDSLMSGQTSLLLNGTISGLIVLGGLGFPVVYEIFRRFFMGQSDKISIQTKSVMLTTLGLTLAGILVILVSERTLIPSLGWKSGILTSAFQSITCRTAGFNTLDIASLNTATLLFMMFLMLIGASPGSCGGGIKTTTFAVLAIYSWSRLMRRRCVNLFSKTLPDDTVSKSIFILLFSLTTLCLAVFIILFIDPDHGTRIQGNRQFFKLSFRNRVRIRNRGAVHGGHPGFDPAGQTGDYCPDDHRPGGCPGHHLYYCRRAPEKRVAVR